MTQQTMREGVGLEWKGPIEKHEAELNHGRLTRLAPLCQPLYTTSRDAWYRFTRLDYFSGSCMRVSEDTGPVIHTHTPLALSSHKRKRSLQHLRARLHRRGRLSPTLCFP